MRIGPTRRAWKRSVGRWIGVRTPSRAVDCDVPSRVRAALDRTALRDVLSPSIGWRSAKSLTMIDRVVGNKLLPASVRQDIIERTDGIPLFVEEMTKAVLEAESEGAVERLRASGSIVCSRRPSKPARIADGAARPARPSEGSGADRRGDWAGVFSRATGSGGTQAGAGVDVRVGPS